jgi:hypothetical protein
MADVNLGGKKNYQSTKAVVPVEVLNGTDTVELVFVDDYSALGLKVTDAEGASTVYEVAIAERA